MDTRIYIMTHKQFEVPQVEGYIPLHVGKESKADLGYLCDNSGNHISEKNSSFCELTGLYWMWKNVQCDIIGLCHYRRYFVKRELEHQPIALEQKILDKAYIEEYLKKYDMIIPNSAQTEQGSVYKHYEERHHISDWLSCGEIIKEKYPKYYPAFTWSQDCNFISLGNMVITKKEILDEYCEWLFDILFELEQRVDISDYDSYQHRIFGFLSERLFRVWVMSHPLKVREEQVLMVE